jgi:hypothetical protein
MTALEVLNEFGKGCSNAPHEAPWRCRECTEAAANALRERGEFLFACLLDTLAAEAA